MLTVEMLIYSISAEQSKLCPSDSPDCLNVLSFYSAVRVDGRMAAVSQVVISTGKMYITSQGYFPLGMFHAI